MLSEFRNLCVLLLLVFGLAAAPAQAQNAQSAEDALAKIAAGGFADVEAGITTLGPSGLPTARAIIEALNDGRLFVRDSDKALVYKDAAGKVFDAKTGASLAASDDLKAIKVNNRVRRAAETALSQLSVVSADPAQRLASAEAAFKAHDAGALAAVEAAIAQEKDANIKRAFVEARAAILLANGKGSEADRLDGVQLMQARGDKEALAFLRVAAASATPIASTAGAALGAIERRLALNEAAQNVWYGISLGSVLLLAAIGLAITFGVMGIINMAHGEMVMIGAYATFVVQGILRAQFPALLPWTLAFAVPLAFIAAALTGMLIERLVIRWLYGRPLETLLATWGVSLILQQAVRSAFGPTNREVSAPPFMSGAFEFYGLQINYGRLYIVVFAICVFVGLLLILRATSFGLKIRAVTQNRRMAAAMGIRTPWVDTMAFGLGSGIAGMAGVALSQIDNVSPNLGQGYIIDSFMVVVFGGAGNLWGTLAGAMTLGIANKLLEPFAGAVLGKILLLVFIILFIQKRPRGLFALKGRAVEA